MTTTVKVLCPEEKMVLSCYFNSLGVCSIKLCILAFQERNFIILIHLIRLPVRFKLFTSLINRNILDKKWQFPQRNFWQDLKYPSGVPFESLKFSLEAALRGVLSLGKSVLKICSKLAGLNLQKVAKHLSWNYTSAWAFSYKFAANFHDTFS